MGPWCAPPELVNDFIFPHYYFISAVVSAVPHFCFGWMELNVNTHDVGLFIFFCGDEESMIIFLVMDINFIWATNQYKNF